MVSLSLTSIANILSIGVNSLLIILKLSVGFIFQSISLVADGFDSVLDLVSATSAGIGERMSRKPADSSHPFGHQKFQLIAGLSIAFTMFVSSYFIADEAIRRLRESDFVELDIWILIAAIISFVGKLLLSMVLMRIGKKLKSPVYIANAKNYRTDSIASLFVCFAFIGAKFNVLWLDSAFAFVIVALILYTGYEISKMVVPELLDKGAPIEVINKLKQIALSFEEVKEVHIIRLRSLFDNYTGDFHILVDSDLTIMEAHDISEKVNEKLEAEGIFTEILIHIEPYSHEESLKGEENGS